nr:hypothetical protein HUO10_004256 [Paraburkholderia busanensis]
MRQNRYALCSTYGRLYRLWKSIVSLEVVKINFRTPYKPVAWLAHSSAKNAGIKRQKALRHINRFKPEHAMLCCECDSRCFPQAFQIFIFSRESRSYNYPYTN